MLAVLSLLVNFFVNYESNLGASIVMNDEFYAILFMSPLYHLTTFLIGVASSLFYNDFI